MTLTFVFWNFNPEKGDSARPITSEEDGAALLGRVVEEFRVDLLILAECSIDQKLLLKALRSIDPRFDFPGNLHARFRYFTRFPSERLRSWASDSRMAVQRLTFDGYDDVLLATFHYVDGWHNSPEKQFRDLHPYRATLFEAELMANHSRTILVGDLNMNPFDPGMLDPKFGLGALMTRRLAEAHAEAKTGNRFYNPMWALMGRAEAPGTFYWSADEPKNPYWNCLDGVLVRPALFDWFRDEDLKIISRLTGPDGDPIDLIRFARRHCHTAYSDHLPIQFKLTLSKAPKPQEGDYDQSDL